MGAETTVSSKLQKKTSEPAHRVQLEGAPRLGGLAAEAKGGKEGDVELRQIRASSCRQQGHTDQPSVGSSRLLGNLRGETHDSRISVKRSERVARGGEKRELDRLSRSRRQGGRLSRSALTDSDAEWRSMIQDPLRSEAGLLVSLSMNPLTPKRGERTNGLSQIRQRKKLRRDIWLTLESSGRPECVLKSGKASSFHSCQAKVHLAAARGINDGT